MTDRRKPITKTPPDQKPTRSDIAPLKLPLHCITPSALRGLASAIDRLTAFHKKAGGTSPHEPCLSAVAIEKDGTVAAYVVSNGNRYRLVYTHGSWEFR